MNAIKNTSNIPIAKHQKLLAEKERVIAEQARRIIILEEYVLLDKIKKYGASSEKSADQQEMFVDL